MTDWSDEIVRVYQELEDQLLINLAHHFKGGNPNTASFNYNTKKLAELGMVRSESAQIIADYVRENEPMITRAVERAMLDALGEVEPELQKAAKKGLLHNAKMTVREGMQEALTSYSRQALDQSNLVNTVMLDSTLQAFENIGNDITTQLEAVQKALNAETGKVITGVSSYQEAVKNAVKRASNNGLDGFIDHGGHHWSPEAYMRMDIVTTCNNAARQAVFDRNESYGNDLVYVRTNATAREKCYPWQGKVISQNGNGRTVYDQHGTAIEAVSISDTSYGQPDGLWGINCHHVPPSIFIEGASLVRGAENMPGPEENERRYALTQQQRKCERDVRKAKREANMMKAAGNEAGYQEAMQVVQEKNRALNGLVKANLDVLMKDSSRTWVYSGK